MSKDKRQKCLLIAICKECSKNIEFFLSSLRGKWKMVGGSVGKRIVNRDTVAAAVFLAAATVARESMV